MKRYLLIIIPFGLLTIGCSEPVQEQDQGIAETEVPDGKELMEKRCDVCHNTMGTDNMLAPPMFRVKDHYWDEDVSRSEFVQSIVDWVKDPNEEDSRMPGARNKFGLMPKQVFDEKEVRTIAEYMFDNEL